MIEYLHPAGSPCRVEALCWTPSGKVMCRRRGLLTAFYAVPVFALRHPEGRKALASLLRSLPWPSP